MRELLAPDVAELLPNADAVLRAQGIPSRTEVPKRIRDLLEAAMQSYLRLAAPRAVIQEISIDDFSELYLGEGGNAGETPLGDIYPKADRLALFAATVGAGLSDEIGRLFDADDLALAAMLDSVASEAAEMLANRTAAGYSDRIASELAGRRLAVLPYSPGYCGWHTSGQGRLFACLGPEEIGIRLNESFLMQPLKSVSGVLVAGAPSIHDFDDDFDFCAECTARECRVRIARALEG